MMNSLRAVAVATCLLATTAGASRAQDSTATAGSGSGAATTASKWNYLVEPYLLAPTMDGSSGVRGVSADVSASASDIFSVLKFGAMLYMEASNARWAISMDGLYMNLGDSGSTRLGSVDVGVEQGGLLATGYWRIRPWAELSLAFQYNSVHGSLKGSGPFAVDLSQNESWVDPYLGVRLSASRSEAWNFRFTGNVGGFGVGSDFAWQAFPEAGYRFNPLFELAGGYRAIYMDYTNGSGSDEFTYQLTTSGPQLGAKFHF